MTHFVAILKILNEKKIILIRNNPDRAREVLERIANKHVVKPGQYKF